MTFPEKNSQTLWWRQNIFLDTGLLWRESTGDWWIPLAKASDAELCSAPEQMVEQTIETPVNRDAIALIMTSLQWKVYVKILEVCFN